MTPYPKKIEDFLKFLLHQAKRLHARTYAYSDRDSDRDTGNNALTILYFTKQI